MRADERLDIEQRDEIRIAMDDTEEGSLFRSRGHAGSAANTTEIDGHDIVHVIRRDGNSTLAPTEYHRRRRLPAANAQNRVRLEHGDECISEREHAHHACGHLRESMQR